MRERSEHDSDNALPTEVRREKMLRAVHRQEFARVADLSQRFDVSEVTVRNDLSQLERRGELRRVRGGAMSTRMTRLEHSFERASVASAAEKERIGTAAAAMVRSGEAVILDVGTTVAAMARSLVRREDLSDVMVFTSGLNIALLLEAASPRYTVVVTGGTVRPLQHSLVNPLGTEVLSRIHAHAVFLGCNGVDASAGVSNINLPEAEVKRQMLASSARRIVLADGSKIGKTSLAHVCVLDEIDLVLTDRSADPVAVDELVQVGVDVRIVDEPEG